MTIKGKAPAVTQGAFHCGVRVVVGYPVSAPTSAASPCRGLRSNGEKNYAKESIFGPRRRFMSGWPANPGCQRLVRTGFRPLRPSRAAPEVEIGPNSSGMDQNALRSGSFGTFQASDTLAYSKKFLRYYAKACLSKRQTVTWPVRAVSMP